MSKQDDAQKAAEAWLIQERERSYSCCARCGDRFMTNTWKHSECAYLAGFAKGREMERERAAKVAETGCLVPPDGGSPSEAEAQLCAGIAAAIRGDR